MTTNEHRTGTLAALKDVDLDTDDLFDVLSNSRRRFVVACLHASTDPMAVADVAEELAEWECDTPRDEITSEQVTSRSIALHHTHVPKMVDAGMIEYDRGRKTIALRDDCEEVATEVALLSVS